MDSLTEAIVKLVKAKVAHVMSLEMSTSSLYMAECEQAVEQAVYEVATLLDPPGPVDELARRIIQEID